MDETENFVNFIKGKFTEAEIKMAKFIDETDLLSYTMTTEKVKEGDKLVEKPTNVLELSYLKLCAKKFDDSEDLLEKIFLFYVGYALREYKNSWRLNLNNLDSDLALKCSYCNVDTEVCPFKLVTYIKKCISDNKFDTKKVFDKLISNERTEYNKDQHLIDFVIQSVEELAQNSMDIVCAGMLLSSDSVKLEREESGKLYFKYLDFNVKNNSFFNNLNEFYKENKGLQGELSLSEIKFTENYSYLFDKSPIEIAAYIKYLCTRNNIDEQVVVEKILEKRNFKES